jgi:hypothetical protein
MSKVKEPQEKKPQESLFNQPFSLAKVIWPFMLKIPIVIKAEQVKIISCLPNRVGFFEGWNCLVESSYLANTLLQTETQLLDEFRRFPDNLINNRKIPKLIRDRQLGCLSDFRSHWQSIVQYPLVQVTITDQDDLGVCHTHITNRLPINITLLVKGILVSQTKLGLYVEISSFQNQNPI